MAHLTVSPGPEVRVAGPSGVKSDPATAVPAHVATVQDRGSVEGADNEAFTHT
ncbi:MAG: hypothetical protein JWM59_2741 [Verrucomicrobiales bacterium]|nr:hypothetical protein [Verrucomicrobiales bacterium]